MTVGRRWLYVRKWAEWQTYRNDRGAPPWIKVYRRLLQDLEWSSLTDAEKGQLVSIWILAADRDGYIPDDPPALRRVLGLEHEPDLARFKDLEFLVPCGSQRDADVASEWRQSDAPEEGQRKGRSSTEEGQRKGRSSTEEGQGREDVSTPNPPAPSEPPGSPSRAPTSGAQPTNGRHTERFDAFWAQYPTGHRKAKKRAREIWARKRLDNRADEIMADLARRPVHDDQWRQGYIPNPSTYLNQERWTDDYRQPAAQGARSSTVQSQSDAAIDRWLEGKRGTGSA